MQVHQETKSILFHQIHTGIQKSSWKKENTSGFKIKEDHIKILYHLKGWDMSHVVTFRDQRGKLMWNVPQRNGCKNWGGGGGGLV